MWRLTGKGIGSLIPEVWWFVGEDMGWLIFLDVAACFWRCGGSLVRIYVVSFLEMRWLISIDVVAPLVRLLISVDVLTHFWSVVSCW